MSGTLRRRRAFLAALVVGATTLAGCGLGGGGQVPADDTHNAITVWFPGTNKVEIDLVTKVIVPRFEQETGAKVQVTFVDWSDLSPKLNAAFAAGTAPDVFGHGPAAVADFVANDRVEPLTQQVQSLGEATAQDLKAALPGGQVNGTQYLIPLSMQGNLIVYRAADFTAAGLDPAAPPTTWEGVLDAARKLTVREGGKVTKSGLLLPSHPIGLQQTFAALLGSAGGDQLTPDSKKSAFNSPAGVTALNFLIDVYKGPNAVGANLGANYLDAPTAQQPVITGAAAMTVQTPNAVQQMVAADPGLDLRVMQAPRFAAGKSGIALGGPGPGLMLNKDGAEKELAWRFVSYLVSPEINVKYTKGIGAVPARTSASDSDYVRNSPVLQAFVRAAGNFRPNPNVPGWTRVRDTLAKHLEQGVNQVVDVQTALRQAATEIDGILAAGR